MATPPVGTALVLDLAMAVVGSSNAPILLLDEAFVVVAASKSFARAFGLDAARLPGTALAALGEGEWAGERLASLLRATACGRAAIDCYEIDLIRPDQPPRRVAINAHLLDYGDGLEVRLLFAATDVTDARAAAQLRDDLLREKEVLMKELQHRVANSLQIVASVLMQSARRVQSEEVRGHLADAHQRVMSIAALQKQLAVSTAGQVELRTYIAELCRSIGASMIRDRDQLRIDVDVDDSSVAGDVSVSLGLIVTELVINALKHAYPDGRGGVITVDYRADGASWTLDVCDDGIGMPEGANEAKAGLGTSIVTALAKQLRARIDVRPAKPGTRVCVVHSEAVTQGEGAKVLPLPVVRAI